MERYVKEGGMNGCGRVCMKVYDTVHEKVHSRVLREMVVILTTYTNVIVRTCEILYEKVYGRV